MTDEIDTLSATLVKLPAAKRAQAAHRLSRVHCRLIEPAEQDDQDLAFLHTVFCQTSLPYRDPGDDVRVWKREQGAVSLLVKAGEARRHRQVSGFRNRIWK